MNTLSRLLTRLRREHRDYMTCDPLTMSLKLVRRIHPTVNDPTISAQAYSGWSTYALVGRPHTMRECPFRKTREIGA